MNQVGDENEAQRTLWYRGVVRNLFKLFAVLILAGCGGAAQSPQVTAQQFARALVDGRLADAYGQLSARYRRRVPLAEFREQVTDHPDEARRLARLLRDGEDGGDVTAVVQLNDGDAIHLIMVEGEWRIEGNPANFYDQSTPRRALRSFVRALERRRYEMVMRFVPNADREGMTTVRMREAWEGEGREEIERLAAALRDNLDAPIEEIGDRATMAYGEGSAVLFLREDGVWKIEDPS